MSIVNKFFVSRQVILEMLEDRGWDTTEYQNYGIDDIDIMLKNMSIKNKEISTLDILIKGENNKILVKYVLTSKIRGSNITSLTESLIEDVLEDGDELIIIIMDRLTNDSALESYFNNLYNKRKIYSQYFWIKKLTYNVTKHETVPKHEILTSEEINEVLQKYNIIDVTKFNFIKQNDVVAKYYGMKIGDVCRIIRKSETAGIYINYRLCVL